MRLATGGSDQLAARNRAGARPDVYAAADAALPRALHAEGRVWRPVAFAANEPVVAVPAGSRRVRELGDLARPGVRIAGPRSTASSSTSPRGGILLAGPARLLTTIGGR